MSDSVKIGDWVLAKAVVFELEPDGEMLVYAKPGDIGHVIGLYDTFLPTVMWERTGMVCDSDPEVDFDWLCGPEFGRDPPRVPKIR